MFKGDVKSLGSHIRHQPPSLGLIKQVLASHYLTHSRARSGTYCTSDLLAQYSTFPTHFPSLEFGAGSHVPGVENSLINFMTGSLCRNAPTHFCIDRYFVKYTVYLN